MDFGLGFLNFGTEMVGKIIENGYMEEDRNQRQEFSAGQVDLAQRWAEKMSNTSYQRAVADLQAAGLNPMLAVARGGASTPSVSPAGSSGGSGPGMATRADWAAAAQSASAIAVNQAVEERTRAEAAKVRAEEKEVIARTEVHGATVGNLQQQVAESRERVIKIMAESVKIGQEERTSAAQQHLYEQQRRNLLEEVSRIRQTVRQLEASTGAEWARERNLSAQETEVRQRVRQNMPEIQRRLKDLEEKSLVLSMPQRGMDAAAREGFMGAWNAVLRALSGQK